MNSREEILGRIRRALWNPAPPPGSHAGSPVAPNTDVSLLPMADQPPPAGAAEDDPVFIETGAAPAAGPSAWLPAVGESWDERAEMFAANAAALKAEFVICADWPDAQERMAALAEESAWKRVASHPGVLTYLATLRLDTPIVAIAEGYDRAEIERCDAAVTECDALIAQTGSVVVTSHSAGGRVLSALSPHHVVVASRDQLLADLPSAFDLLRERYSENYPSLISLITGPSCTGDIERVLVLGAHGPKRLTILCVLAPVPEILTPPVGETEKVNA